MERMHRRVWMMISTGRGDGQRGAGKGGSGGDPRDCGRRTTEVEEECREEIVRESGKVSRGAKGRGGEDDRGFQYDASRCESV
jgi:hypothetical protein